MAIWASIFAGLVIGAGFGGQKAIQAAAEGRLDDANRWLNRGSWLSACGAAVCVSICTGWPYLLHSESVVEEVSRTVVETIQVPMEVTRWVFWTRTDYREEQVLKTIKEPMTRSVSVRRFSALMLIPLGLIAWSTYFLYCHITRMVWRWCQH